MKLMESMIGWNPGTHEIRIGAWPDHYGWSDKYAFTSGACMTERHKMTSDQQALMMLLDFHTIVVRDRVPVNVAHFEFSKIEEYRQRISRDTPGAEGEPDL